MGPDLRSKQFAYFAKLVQISANGIERVKLYYSVCAVASDSITINQRISCMVISLTYSSLVTAPANKVYPDQTASRGLSDQGILYLPMCDPRGIIFLCPSAKNIQFA